MNKILVIFIFLLLLLPNIGLAQANEVYVYVFYSQGCPSCGALLNYLEGIKNDYPTLNVHTYEMRYSQENRQMGEDFAEAYNFEMRYVPDTFIDNEVIVGYDSNAIKGKIEYCLVNPCIDPYEKAYGTINGTNTSIIEGGDVTELPGESLTLPMLIGFAAADAVNPCEWAVLILLLTVILGTGDRKKALKAGFSFSIAIYIMYFLMGLAIFSIVQIAAGEFGLASLFYKAIAIFGIIVGVLNIKDFIKPGAGGFEMAVPMSWRPRMKKIIAGAVSVPGAFIVGAIVSFFLTPCTAGPYLVILTMMANEATMMAAIPLLLLYNFIFILPMIGITLIVYWGLTTPEKAEKWREEKVKYMHLIAGLILVIISAYILWMFA